MIQDRTTTVSTTSQTWSCWYRLHPWLSSVCCTVHSYITSSRPHKRCQLSVYKKATDKQKAGLNAQLEPWVSAAVRRNLLISIMCPVTPRAHTIKISLHFFAVLFRCIYQFPLSTLECVLSVARNVKYYGKQKYPGLSLFSYMPILKKVTI